MSASRSFTWCGWLPHCCITWKPPHYSAVYHKLGAKTKQVEDTLDESAQNIATHIPACQLQSLTDLITILTHHLVRGCVRSRRPRGEIHEGDRIEQKHNHGLDHIAFGVRYHRASPEGDNGQGGNWQHLYAGQSRR